MDYSIKIDEFEGPMDLLLHLIKQSNIDIYNISIEKITKDYFNYLNSMEKLNINIAASYLVMAAELMEIKSKSLLPNNIIEEEIDEEVSKEKLINKLIEYKKYKELTPTFKQMELDRQEIFIKSPESVSNYIEVNSITNSDIGVEELFLAFSKFLERKELEKPLNTRVTNKEYSVKDRKNDIRKILEVKKIVSFDEIFEVFSKPFIVVTFLSILEMAKENVINIKQENNFSKITLELRG